MGRSYAGILGPLAFLTEIARGASRSAGTESTVMTAVAALFVFAFVGFVLGELAGWIVNDSIRSRLAAEIAAAKPVASAAGPGVAAVAHHGSDSDSECRRDCSQTESTARKAESSNHDQTNHEQCGRKAERAGNSRSEQQELNKKS